MSAIKDNFPVELILLKVRMDRHFSLVDIGNNYLIFVVYFIFIFIFSSSILDFDKHADV
jgi:hypothetical protein